MIFLIVCGLALVALWAPQGVSLYLSYREYKELTKGLKMRDTEYEGHELDPNQYTVQDMCNLVYKSRPLFQYVPSECEHGVRKLLLTKFGIDLYRESVCYPVTRRWASSMSLCSVCYSRFPEKIPDECPVCKRRVDKDRRG